MKAWQSVLSQPARQDLMHRQKLKTLRSCKNHGTTPKFTKNLKPYAYNFPLADPSYFVSSYVCEGQYRIKFIKDWSLPGEFTRKSIPKGMDVCCHSLWFSLGFRAQDFELCPETSEHNLEGST